MQRLTRRDFMAAITAAAGGVMFGCKSKDILQTNVSHRPNILLIVADDLGYADLGCQGQFDISTPHIDSLAANGTRFTDAYVTGPVCGPSRAGFLTGRYQTGFGYEYNIEPHSDNGLPLSELTFGERFKAAGYRTGLIGKWHQGETQGYLPNDRGFDEFFGFLGGSHYYFPDDGRGVEQTNYNWTLPMYRNYDKVEEVNYLTDAFARESVGFIDRNAANPFFLYVSFNAVHSPLEVVDKYKEQFSSTIKDKKRLIYAAMLKAMDDAVGQVVEALRRNNIEEDTLIFFISDNGGPTKETTSSNLPLSGGKSQLLEGGIRVPMIIQWKGGLPGGKVYKNPVISLDILPTALAAADVSHKNSAFDGVNLLPYIKGADKSQPHDILCWRYGNASAIRKGDYKILAGNRKRLFNLNDDIAEKNDLSETMPEKFKELEDAYNQWNSRNKDSLWPRPNYGALPKNVDINALE